MSEYDKLRTTLPANITRGDVSKVLRALVSEDSPWEWFSRARIPFPYVVTILRALRDQGYLAFDPTQLTDRGEALAGELGGIPTPDLKCSTCGGSGTDWQALDVFYQQYLEIFKARPRNENPDLDQGAMTPESLFRRIALMVQQGDVATREIVTLGDDDLASVALALTAFPERVTVLEIDPRLCEYISNVAAQNDLNIRVIQQDLAARLPHELVGSFDTFVCDPPETEAGLLLFVEKGLALLKPGEAHAGYFGATVMEASLSKWKRWQARLLQNEIAFTHILSPFSEYEAWPDEKPLPDLLPLAEKAENPWYRFAFYRLETLPTFKPKADFELEHSKIFYFDAESYYEAFK
ncbi:MAG: bis-aminopropyl spermidine synthase family protein [Anaerolineae bacterium]